MRDDEMCGNTIGMRRDVPGNARKIAKAARKNAGCQFFSHSLNYVIICRSESLILGYNKKRE